jgi:hypothetical protein
LTTRCDWVKSKPAGTHMNVTYGLRIRPGRAMNVKSAVFECGFVRSAVCIPDGHVGRGSRIG